jgi:hypothetical protein
MIDKQRSARSAGLHARAILLVPTLEVRKTHAHPCARGLRASAVRFIARRCPSLPDERENESWTRASPAQTIRDRRDHPWIWPRARPGAENEIEFPPPVFASLHFFRTIGHGQFFWPSRMRGAANI